MYDLLNAFTKWTQRLFTFCGFLFLIQFALAWDHVAMGQSKQSEEGAPTPVISTTRIPFIFNTGQCDDQVAFYARTFGGTVFVTKGGDLVYALPCLGEDRGARGWVLEEVFKNGAVSEPKGMAGMAARINVFKGSDPAKWRSGIPSYANLDLGEVYEGIDVRLVAHGDNVEKIFTVKPDASPGKIRIKIRGALELNVNEAGALEVRTGLGTVTFTRPVAWQEVEGEKMPVDVAYTLTGDGYGFEVQEYDRKKALVIDPLLASTFLGGGNEDRGLFMAVADNGDVYASGYTLSSDFPTTPGAFDENYNGGEYDFFVSLFDGDLSTLIASTFLGGTGDEGWFYQAITLDDAGNVYVAGNTASADFPTTTGVYDESYNGGAGGPYGCGGDIFLAKLDKTLTTLLASTFVGGGGHEYCGSLVLDDNGIVRIAGSTSSGNFPVTPGAYDETHQPGGNWSEDLILCKMDPDLKNLLASTYLGGTHDDFCEGFRVDNNGNSFVAGWTASTNFPTTPGAYDTTYNGYYYDAFVSSLNEDLTALTASTYLGGSSWEFGYSLEMDLGGNVYVTGHTASTNFPTTPGAYCTKYKGIGGANLGDDVFVSKFDADLATLLASTYLGGTKWENATSLALDGRGNIFVAGSTSSLNFPVGPGAYQTQFSGGTKHYGDVFVARLDTDLTDVPVATYLGGTGEDSGLYVSLALGTAGSVYVGGPAGSSDFPVTSGAYDPVYNGGKSDVFIAKLDALLCSDYLLHEATGGTLLFDVDCGAGQAGRNYILLGSISGTTPGTPLPGGTATLPLNWDLFTSLILVHMNTPLFQDFMGTLDSQGRAIAAMTLGPMPGAAGITMHFAHALNQPWNFVSDPLLVQIVP